MPEVAEKELKLDTKSIIFDVREAVNPSNKKQSVILSIDNVEIARTVHVMFHNNGLVVTLVPRYRFIATEVEIRRIIPGQYKNIDEVAMFIAKLVSINKINEGQYLDKAVEVIKQKLLSSKIWETRGMLKSGWKNVPEEFWSVVSIENFGIGTIKSYYEWWLSALLYRGGRAVKKNGWFLKKDVDKKVKDGNLPEKLNCIRYWNRLSFDELMAFVAAGYSDCKQWGPFIMHVKDTFYKEFMVKHNDWLESNIFDEVVEYLARCPKNLKFVEAINNLANTGLSAKEIVSLNLTNAKEVAKAADYSHKFQQIYRRNQRHLNSTYRIPKLKNIIDEKKPEKNWEWNKNYLWADHLTFPNLSNWYKNCISGGYGYESGICDGKAHVVYAEDHSPENEGGVVAYLKCDYAHNNYNRYGEPTIKLDKDGNEIVEVPVWRVQEMRSFANQAVSARHQTYVNEVVKQLNKQLPGFNTPVKDITKEELIAELAMDEIGSKVKNIWELRNR